MNDTDFLRQKQDAIKRMMSYKGNSFSDQNGVHAPDFVKLFNDGDKKQSEKEGFNFSLPFNLENGGFPFLERLKNDKDLGLILGLLLLLVCENADKLTLIALVYILL